MPDIDVPPRPAPPARGTRDMVRSPEFLLTVGVLAVVILVGAFAVHVVGRWRRRGESLGVGPLSLSDYRAMYESGEITEGEYDRIRARLAAKIKAEVGIAPPAPPEPPPPAQPE